MRLIDGNALYEKTAEWEAQALHMVNTMHDEDTIDWKVWSAILQERSVFKFDVADAPTIDAAPVVRCRECKWSDNYGLDLVCQKHSGITKNRLGEDIHYVEWHSKNYFCADGERRDAK